MKRINNEYILSLNPCEDRRKNYLKHYKNTNFSVVEFLKLDNISYEDKIWVWKKFATINEAAIFGLKCASSVLDIFENKYPLDKRPRLALEAVEAFINNPTDKNKELCKAAADVAYAAADAAVNAADADDAVNAYSAAKIQQEEVNLMFLIEIYEENEVKK